MTNRYLCIHGHFYQPPRENPWIESVEVQDSAAPYHDWNERITAECYARNGASRVVDERNRVLRIVNNYARMSFNFGPTLLSWLESQAPLTYRSILDADRASAARFGGHGSAMAQVYNHIILPLASRRDKEIQVRWGIADFERRFNRKPEGMWLAETAVDTESLEVLAENGIRFTVLAPSQCAAVRPLATAEPAGEPGGPEEPWHPTPDASVETRQPYLVQLPGGRSIAVFFYDGPRSRAIAFEHLLNSGEGYAQRMMGGFSSDSPSEPELVHVATDGESYGHHHRFGEMGLSYALQYVEERGLATLTNYGEFLATFPPAMEARIHEATSWSCAHGVERWRSDCGCNGGKPGWNQLWRAPLRHALDGLRDGLAPLTGALGAKLFRDWPGAVDRYAAVILDRARASSFLKAEQAGPLTEEERTEALQLLELVRHAQLMYTSCGWFFDDIAGIETVQIVAYAARVLELAGRLFGPEGAALEGPFLAGLAQAQSNDPTEGSGADIYAKRANAARVGLVEVAAHYAISSVFRPYPERARVFCFELTRLSEVSQSSGHGRLLAGEAEVRSTLTHERARVAYAVLHFGDQNLAAGVRLLGGASAHARFIEEARAAFLRADLPSVIRLFDREFTPTYTIRSLFTDEQRWAVNLILNQTVAAAEENLVRLYDDHASLLHFLSQAEVPRPPALALAANFTLNLLVKRALAADPIDGAQLRSALALAAQDRVALDRQELSFVADRRMSDAMAAFAARPADLSALENAHAVAEALRLLPFEANIWQAQNLWHALASAKVPVADRALFGELGEALAIAVNSLSLNA